MRQLVTVELWTDLPQAGGTQLVNAIRFQPGTGLDLSESGDDRGTLIFPLSDPAKQASRSMYAVFRLAGGQVVAMRCATVEQTLETDSETVTLASARTRLTTSVTDAAFTGRSPGFYSGQINKPAWVAIGPNLVADTYGVSVDVTFAGDTTLTAYLKLVDAINAVLAPGSAPAVLAFYWTSATVMTIDVVSTVPQGTQHLLEEKMLVNCTHRDDATDPAVPVESLTMKVLDVGRVLPTTFPRDDLQLWQQARVQSRRLGLDASYRITRITTTFDTPFADLELGTPRRELARDTTLADAIAAIPPPQIILYLTPLSVLSDRVIMRVQAVVPLFGATVTLTYQIGPGSLSISPASGATLVATDDIATTGHVDFTILRDAFGTVDGQVSFTGSATGYLDSAAAPITVETVSDLASGPKTLRVAAVDLTPCGAYSRARNADGTIQSAAGASVEQYSASAAFPEGVTVITMVVSLLGATGEAQCALIRDGNTVVGSTLVSASGALAAYSQSLSEYVGTSPGAHIYSILVSFNGGAVPADRIVGDMIFTYTSPTLQNTY